MNLSKKNLIVRIQNRFGGALPQRQIGDAVASLLALLEEQLICGNSVTVHNFGSLSPYVYPSRRALDVVTGRIRQTKPFRSVRFHAHVGFKQIVELRLKHRASIAYVPPKKS